jgi:glycosyltransferase involved in cell wall biosynthesis
MRIYEFITPSRIGGAETHIMDLSESLTQRGHEVTIICPQGRSLIAHLRRRQFRLRTPRLWSKFDLPTLLRLAARLRRERVDLLHTHLSTASLIGSLAARIAGIPAVATVHGLNHRAWYRLAPHIIAVSEAVKAHLVAQGMPADRIRVIRCGVDSVRLTTAAAEGAHTRARLGVRPDEFLIGVVQRLDPEKGQANVIEAAAELVHRQGLPLRVVLVGEGRHRAALERLARARRLDDRVIFAGFQPEVAPYYAAMDVVCVASLREALSLLAIEAMALGRPVVASRVGGLPEVVADEETGLLVPPGDPAALAVAIARLLREPDTARRMGAAGRARVERLFTRERMVDQIEQVYQEVTR